MAVSGSSYTAEASVTASITNAVSGDDVSVVYDSNSTTSATNVGNYTATVSGLDGDDASNYTIEGIFTDLDGETHHLTYTGPLPISNEVEEPTPALSTLTGDVNADVDCDGFIYRRIVGNTRQIKLQTATTGVAYDTFFTIVASVSSDETSLYTGNFTINDSGKAYYAVAGYIDEATGKKEGCWVECSDGTYAPLVSGSLQVNMSSGTITINAQDDANHTITGSITGMSEAFPLDMWEAPW